MAFHNKGTILSRKFTSHIGASSSTVLIRGPNLGHCLLLEAVPETVILTPKIGMTSIPESTWNKCLLDTLETKSSDTS